MTPSLSRSLVLGITITHLYVHSFVQQIQTVPNTETILIRTNVLNNFKNCILLYFLLRPRAFIHTPIIIYTICILTHCAHTIIHIFEFGILWSAWLTMLHVHPNKNKIQEKKQCVFFIDDAVAEFSSSIFIYILFASSQLAIFNVQIIGKHSFSYYIRVSTLLLILL